jgi:hypothetical protein
MYKTKEDSEEDKARKDIARQERRMEKDMKERRLALKEDSLKKEENLLRTAKDEVDAADLADDRKIRMIRDRIRARETYERQEKERAERERLAKIRKQQREEQEKRDREAAEAYRKRQAEARAAEQKLKEEQAKQWQKTVNELRKKANHSSQHARSNVPQRGARRASKLTCSHDGWWPKVQGQRACPECSDVWTYLLQCPGCDMEACPKCQAAIRPSRPRTHRRAPPRVRTPSPDFSYYDWD